MNDELQHNNGYVNDTANYDSDLPKGKEGAHNSEVRKRIDDLLEKKRLKELLDDSDDW
jgi:hypothetical protein